MSYRSLRRSALRLSFAAPRWLGHLVQAAAVGVLWHMSSIDSCDGIPVAVADKDKAQLLRGRVCTALTLIHDLDPRRYRNVRRRLAGILVAQPGTGAKYSTGTRVCLLRRQQVEERSAAWNACSIIHETTHARLASINTLLPTKRIEACCIREQIAFAERLPRDQYPNTDAYIRYFRSWIGVWPLYLRFGPRYRRLLQERASPPAA